MKSLIFFIYFYPFSIFHMPEKLDTTRFFWHFNGLGEKKRHLAEIRFFTKRESVFMMWMGRKIRAGGSVSAAE